MLDEYEVQVRIFEDCFIVYIVEKGITKLLNYYTLEGEDQNIYTLLNSCINTGIDTNKFLQLDDTWNSSSSSAWMTYEQFGAGGIVTTTVGLLPSSPHPTIATLYIICLI